MPKISNNTKLFARFGITDPGQIREIEFFSVYITMSTMQQMIDRGLISNDAEGWIASQLEELDVEAFEQYGVTNLLQPAEA